MALMVLCGKRYTLANVAAALTMALSAFCFAVGARPADADFNFLGVLLNGLYLLFQALQVALQDSALRAPVWKSRVCRGHPIILHQVISRRRRGRPGSRRRVDGVEDDAMISTQVGAGGARPGGPRGRGTAPAEGAPRVVAEPGRGQGRRGRAALVAAARRRGRPRGEADVVAAVLGPQAPAPEEERARQRPPRAAAAGGVGRRRADGRRSGAPLSVLALLLYRCLDGEP